MYTFSIRTYNRLLKDKSMYEKEVIEQEAKIEFMKQSGADEYNIKKQVRTEINYLFEIQILKYPVGSF